MLKKENISLNLSIRTKIIIQFITFFIILAIAASVFTLISANISHYFGGDIEIFHGIFCNYGTFLSFIVSILIMPFVLSYVNAEREKLRDAIKNGHELRFKTSKKISFNAILSNRTKNILQFVFQFMIFFIILIIAAFTFALLSTNISYYFGGNIEIFNGIFWDYSIFLSYIVSILIMPLVLLYVNTLREKLKDALKNAK